MTQLSEMLDAMLRPEQANQDGAWEMPFPQDSFPAIGVGTPGIFTTRMDAPNLVLAGCPGSGKTTFTLLLALLYALAPEHQDKLVIYAAPTRPLAQEVYARLTDMADDALNPASIILSTGDETMDDWRIHHGGVKICCTVFEKALSLILSNWKLCQRVSLAIIDEAHMFNERERGVKLDMLLAALMTQKRPSPRLVLNTVEGKEGRTLLLERLAAENGRTAPVLLSGGKRPVPVEHILAIPTYGRAENGKSRYRELVELPLATLGKGENIYISETESVSLRQRIQDFIERQKCDPVLFPAIDIHAVNEYAEKHKKLLIVSMSIRGLTKSANLYKKFYGKKLGIPKCFARRLEQLEKEGVISRRVARSLLELAECGIFLHVGTMHKELRAAVEEVFHEDNDDSYVLFATTTLAYGVNLHVDCVILTSLTHPPKNDPLDGIIFHNILGRAGRYGQRPGSAVILLSNVSREADAPWIQALADCYRPQALKVLSPNPLAPDGASDNPELWNLLLFALWMADNDSGSRGAPKRPGQLAKFLRLTIHARHAGISSREVRDLIGRAFLKMADVECEGQRIVEMGTDGEGNHVFSITTAGKALVETGSRVQEIWNMGACLRGFKENGLLDKFKPVPMLFWLAPLAANLDALRDVEKAGSSRPAPNMNQRLEPMVLRRIRGKNTKIIGEDEARELYKGFVYVFKREIFRSICLDNIDKAPDLDSRRKDELRTLVYNANFGGKECFKGIPRAICPRPDELSEQVARATALLLALWLWIDGEPLDDVEMVLDLHKDGKKSGLRFFSSRWTEQRSWRAKFMASFFAESTLLNTAQAHDIAMLAKRLQMGLVLDHIPGFGKNMSRNMMTGRGGYSPERGLRIFERQKEYYRNENFRFFLWLLTSGFTELAEKFWEFAQNFWVEPEHSFASALDWLQIRIPEISFKEAFTDLRESRWLGFVWAGFALAALHARGAIGRGNLPEKPFLGMDELYAFVDQLEMKIPLFTPLLHTHNPKSVLPSFIGGKNEKI